MTTGRPSREAAGCAGGRGSPGAAARSVDTGQEPQHHPRTPHQVPAGCLLARGKVWVLAWTHARTPRRPSRTPALPPPHPNNSQEPSRAPQSQISLAPAPSLDVMVTDTPKPGPESSHLPPDTFGVPWGGSPNGFSLLIVPFKAIGGNGGADLGSSGWPRLKVCPTR